MTRRRRKRRPSELAATGKLTRPVYDYYLAHLGHWWVGEALGAVMYRGQAILPDPRFMWCRPTTGREKA